MHRCSRLLLGRRHVCAVASVLYANDFGPSALRADAYRLLGGAEIVVEPLEDARGRRYASSPQFSPCVEKGSVTEGCETAARRVATGSVLGRAATPVSEILLH